MTAETTEMIQRREMPGELTILELAGNMEKLRAVMKQVMVQDTDYGIIPGTRSKPTLLKPGAEKLCLMFRFSDEYEETIIELPGGHREYRTKCKLTHIPTGALMGEATATCTTMESKYRYRAGTFECPECKSAAIIKGKAEYGGGWICYAKKGGCGAKFPDDRFNSKDLGKVENPDLADSYHNVQSIAQKRAYLAATRKATASSELFTDSMEDHVVPGASQDHDDAPPDDRRPVEPTKPAPARYPPCPKCGGVMRLVHRKDGSGSFLGCTVKTADGWCKGTCNVPDDGQGKQPDPPDASNQVLSRDFEQLRENLYTMGVPKGNVLHADAVINWCVAGASIKGCSKDPQLACRVLDELAARNAVGATPEEMYQQALAAAGLLTEAAEEHIPY